MLIWSFVFVFCLMWAVAMTVCSIVYKDKIQADEYFTSALCGWFGTALSLYWLLENVIDAIKELK